MNKWSSFNLDDFSVERKASFFNHISHLSFLDFLWAALLLASCSLDLVGLMGFLLF